MTDLSLLIVNYNTWRLCVDALRSFRAHPPRRADGSELDWEVIVVDNASPQPDAGAAEEIRALIGDRGKLILHDENGGYSTGMNLAYRHSRGRILLVSNPDVLFTPDCATRQAAAVTADLSIGAAAPRGYLDEGLEGHLPPNILPTIGDLWRSTLAALGPRFVRSYSRRRTADALRTWQADRDVELEMLSGCCFTMRRDFVEEIGFFDERFPLYYEDTDLSMRIRRARRRIVQIENAHLVHLYDRSAQTSKDEAMRRYWISRRAYYRKWYGWLGMRFYDLCLAITRSGFGQRQAQRPPQPQMVDLGRSTEPPVIPLPGGSDGRFLVEMSLDPRFYLAAGAFGQGDRWSPGPALFAAFGPTTYYFRILDLSGDRPREVGVYSYTREYPAPTQPPEAPAPAGAEQGQ